VNRNDIPFGRFVDNPTNIKVEAPVVYFPGLHPSLLCMPRGQGHWAYGRYATGRGINPLTVLETAVDPLSGTLATGSTKVRIERVSRRRQLVMLDEYPHATGMHPKP
jgi:anaerobic selenocysteine-containing dehydrogenase